MSYPAKIKQLMEEVRFAKEKQLELRGKIGEEKNGLARQNERLNNLESAVQQASGEQSAFTNMAAGHGNIGYQLDSSDYVDDSNQILIDRVLNLEKDQAEKV